MKRFALLFLAACGGSDTTTDAGTDAHAETTASSDAATDGATSASSAASPSTACNASGLYIATSAGTLTCGSPLSTQLVKPYLQLRLPSTTAGTYTVSSDCAQGGNVVEAMYDDAQGTHDAVSGTVTIATLGASDVTGSYDLDFGTTKLKTSFDALYCP